MPEINLPTKAVQDLINVNVGNKADVASPSGSVHAKLKDIKNNLTSISSTRSTYTGKFTSSASTNYQTALLLSGSGTLHFVRLHAIADPNANPSAKIKITIDGRVVFEATNFEGTNSANPVNVFLSVLSLIPPSGTSRVTNSYSGMTISDLNMDFSSTLKIEVAGATHNSTTTPTTVTWLYSKEV